MQFSIFASPTSFSKKAALPKMASLLWHLIMDLNLVGLCDRNLGLNTKCAVVKDSQNVDED